MCTFNCCYMVLNIGEKQLLLFYKLWRMYVFSKKGLRIFWVSVSLSVRSVFSEYWGKKLPYILLCVICMCCFMLCIMSRRHAVLWPACIFHPNCWKLMNVLKEPFLYLYTSLNCLFSMERNGLILNINFLRHQGSNPRPCACSAGTELCP